VVQRAPRAGRVRAAARALRPALVRRALDGGSRRSSRRVRGPRLRPDRFALGRRSAPARVSPDLRATYRLQLGPGLCLRRTRRLRDLGISHLYLSPVLQARSGSTHGYDVVDPARVSDDLGGEEELRRLCKAGLGVVLDVVPNHMATSEENRFWADPDLRRKFF